MEITPTKSTAVSKAVFAIQQQSKFPILVRNKIEDFCNRKELKDIVAEANGAHTREASETVPATKNVETQASLFLQQVEDALWSLLVSNEDDDFGGLDDSRDTEVEVEFAITMFPRALSRIKFGGLCMHPIEFSLFSESKNSHGIVFNCRAISFLPLLARLEAELGRCSGAYQVGLNVALSSIGRYPSISPVSPRIDAKLVQIMSQLRAMKLVDEDAVGNLIVRLCIGEFFCEKLLRYLTSWNPFSLLKPNQFFFNDLPLHRAARAGSDEVVRLIMATGKLLKHKRKFRTIRKESFRIVFEAGMRHFPERGIGILFRQNVALETPFELACKSFGKELAKKVIDDVLTTHPYNPEKALTTLLSDKHSSIDGIYFLLQRNPCLVQTSGLYVSELKRKRTHLSDVELPRQHFQNPIKRKRKKLMTALSRLIHDLYVCN